ncbi:hypothetical protein AOLI_G00165740 [Acnodon oligacanthus]
MTRFPNLTLNVHSRAKRISGMIKSQGDEVQSFTFEPDAATDYSGMGPGCTCKHPRQQHWGRLLIACLPAALIRKKKCGLLGRCRPHSH